MRNEYTFYYLKKKQKEMGEQGELLSYGWWTEIEAQCFAQGAATILARQGGFKGGCIDVVKDDKLYQRISI